MSRVFVYVDGFNLYHSLDELNKNHLKWLNLWSLSEKLIRDHETLIAVKYFSAYATWRFSSFKRHEHYVDALLASNVQVILGKFKKRDVTCKAQCRQIYITHEEKETDVNIGVQLMCDALKGRFDRALVISADTDLNAAVALVRSEAPNCIIDIVAPPKRLSRNRCAKFEISIGKIKRSLFGVQEIATDGRVIPRPVEYNPPIQPST